MSLEDLYVDYNIDTAPSGHKHNRDGWINVVCPHCSSAANSSDGYHLGYNLEGNYFSCYHCGGVGLVYTIGALLHLSKSQSQDLLRQYNVKSSNLFTKKTDGKTINLHPFKFPDNTTPLNRSHKKYLTSRGFDPDLLAKQFGLLGTGAFGGMTDGAGKYIDYRFRIVCPIFWNRKVVSFQTRDYTEKTDKRYVACPKLREIHHHQHILYGKRLPHNSPRRGIIVEGITDAWRLGGFAYATFGISYTTRQLNLIRKLFDHVDIMYDPEKLAQKEARKLFIDLKTRGVSVKNILLDNKDPGAMNQKDADKLLRQLKYI